MPQGGTSCFGSLSVWRTPELRNRPPPPTAEYHTGRGQTGLDASSPSQEFVRARNGAQMHIDATMMRYNPPETRSLHPLHATEELDVLCSEIVGRA